jgi:hypothetical protein
MEVKFVMIRVVTSIGLLRPSEDGNNGYNILLVLVMYSLAATAAVVVVVVVVVVLH